MSGIRLVVQGDDLGMCRAVNEGIALAADEGILTQASVMAPTPWFDEGAGMARRRGLPVGLHVTMTCEWDNLRWAPLSAARTLRGDDGTFVRTTAEVATADEADTVEEVQAQASRVERAGLTPTYVDPHMGAPAIAAHRAACERFGVRFVYKHMRVDPHHDLDSIIVLSTATLEDRPGWLVERLDALGPGTHFVLSHPAIASEELRAIAEPGAENEPWAEPYRAADLASLCDPAVRAVVERKGIELVALRDL